MASPATSSHLPALAEPHERQAIAHELQSTMQELADLSLIGKQLHWAVVGHAFRPVHEHLDELARPREVAGVAVRVALEVVLVLGLGLPEGDGLADLGHDLAGPQARGVDVGDRVLGDPALLVARVEDLGAVAGADVVALAVLGRRVVDLEEELEDVPVGDALGVEDDLDRLGVTGMVAVGRVVVRPRRCIRPGWR